MQFSYFEKYLEIIIGQNMEGHIVIVISPPITEKEIFLVEVAPCQDQKIFLSKINNFIDHITPNLN